MDGTKVKILLIEDNPGDVRLIHEALADSKRVLLDLYHASSLQAGLEYLEERKVDVILLDLSLPDSHGIDTFANLHARAREMPIVIMSGIDDEKLAIDAVQKGAQDYLVKGQTDGKLLYRVIRYAMERKRLERTKDDFVRTVSHELRTPMTIIREGVSQIQSELLGELNDEQKKVVTITLRGIDRLRRIIDNLLDISKIEAGKLTLDRNGFVINEVIQGVVQGFRVHAAKKGLDLKVKCADEKVMVYADRDKLIQVLTNLIGNAIKFTQAGLIEVGLAQKGQFAECYVKDSGAGIAAEHVGKVFNKFEQLNRQSGPGEKGTGLGLAISKNLVELHGGTITVESSKDAGSTFTFTIPLHENEAALQIAERRGY